MWPDRFRAASLYVRPHHSTRPHQDHYVGGQCVFLAAGIAVLFHPVLCCCTAAGHISLWIGILCVIPGTVQVPVVPAHPKGRGRTEEG